jgi:hypothetical protein
MGIILLGILLTLAAPNYNYITNSNQNGVFASQIAHIQAGMVIEFLNNLLYLFIAKGGRIVYSSPANGNGGGTNPNDPKHGHHLWPWYLGGYPIQKLYEIGAKMHYELHSLMDKVIWPKYLGKLELTDQGMLEMFFKLKDFYAKYYPELEEPFIQEASEILGLI